MDSFQLSNPAGHVVKLFVTEISLDTIKKSNILVAGWKSLAGALNNLLEPPSLKTTMNAMAEKTTFTVECHITVQKWKYLST